MRASPVYVLLLCLVAAGCSRSRSYVLPANPDKITTQLLDKSFYLRCTAEYGPFYSIKSVNLLVCRDFEKVMFMQDPFGNYLSPGKPEGRVTVGTEFRVIRIEYPTKEVVEKRPLLSPGYYTWVYLKDYKGSDYVVVLRGARGRDEIYLKEFFAMFSKEIPPLYKMLDEDTRQLVDKRRLKNGMPEKVVYMSQGFPDKVEILMSRDGHKIKKLYYGYRVLTLFDGILKDRTELR